MPLKIVKTQVQLTVATTGFGPSVALPELRKRGQILRVMMREDNTLKKMSNGQVILAEDHHPIGADLLYEDRIYACAAQVWAGSATVAELDANLANTGGVYYDCDMLYAALNSVTAAGGGASTLCTLTIWALVEH